MLKLVNVTKRFFPGTVNERLALDNLTLTLHEGDFVTVIGSNGAGKSTMLNVVAGRYLPDGGQVLIDDREVTKMPEHRRARWVARVFQDPMAGTSPHLTIEENLSIAFERGKRRGLGMAVTKPKRALYREALATLELGLEDRLQMRVGMLSGGQRQALSLAYFEDLTQQQVAAYLGLPLGTAKTRIRTGMQRLRVSLMPIVAAATLAFGGGLAALGVRYHQQQEFVQRQDRALGVVASSSATAARLTAAPGLPAAMHSTYRTSPGADLAIMTFSNFTPAPAGQVYQAWAQQDGAWRSLGAVQLDASGHALAIVDQPGAQAPQALQVTLEPAGGSAAPSGPVVATWSGS